MAIVVSMMAAAIVPQNHLRLGHFRSKAGVWQKSVGFKGIIIYWNQ
jgi:hypothetical protein